MTTRTVKWLSAVVVFFMLVVMVPQTSSAEGLPTVTIKEDTVLTADLNAHVVIGADGITLDGARYSIICDDISKSGGDGISLIGRSGVTIKNCRVIGWFEIGIYLEESSHNKLVNNTVEGIHWKGFFLKYSDNNTVTDNIASRIGKGGGGSDIGYGGFDVWGDSNVVSNNTAIDIDGFGLRGYDLRNNTATGCWDGFKVGPFAYLEGNLAFGNIHGFYLGDYCWESTLVNNTARDNHQGFCLKGLNPVGYPRHYSSCHHNLLVGNTAINNTGRGFDLLFAERNTFMNNVAHDNGDDLYELYSKHNKFIHNDFDDKK